MKMLACQTHVGANNVDFQMEQYVWKRKNDGVHIINLKRTYEKILLAARAIAAIENPADVCVISARIYGQRAVLKFAAHTGATAIVGRFTPGAFTNQIQKAFKEPRLLVVTDPRTDHQAVTEASYVNIPIVALCNTDSPMRFIDVAIPCNNKGAKSIGLMWWMLAREVLTIRGKINRNTGFVLEDKEIMPDLYFYRDPEDAEKEEQAVEKKDEEETWGGPAGADFTTGAPAIQKEAAGGLGAMDSGLHAPMVTDWAAETQSYLVQQSDNMGGGAGNQWGGGGADWS